MTEQLTTTLMSTDLYLSLLTVLLFVALIATIGLVILRKQMTTEAFGIMTWGLWASQHHTANADVVEDYLDSDLFLTQRENLEAVRTWFKESLASEQNRGQQIDRLAFIEKAEGPVGALTLKDLLSWDTKKPADIVRLGRTGPALTLKSAALIGKDGMPRVMKDALVDAEGRRPKVAIVSDALTTGTTIRKAMEILKRSGADVSTAFVLYDREEASEPLSDVGVQVVAMHRRSVLGQQVSKNEELNLIAKKKGVDVQTPIQR